jgi:hypothetical protein
LEKEIAEMLKENNIEFIFQFRPHFLSNGKSHLSLDYYLPEYNIAIECQGKQHYTNNTFFSQNLTLIQERDKKKYELCKENNIEILYYANTQVTDYFGKWFNDKNELLKGIKKI